MVAKYDHDIAAWMDGTEGLDDGEYRVYHVICQLIYLHEGPITMHESGIAGRCNQHPLAFRRNFKKLILSGKLRLDANDKITNARAENEIRKVADWRRRKRPNPKPTLAEPPPSGAGVRGGSEGGSARKPLKSKDPPYLTGDLLSYPIQDTEGASAPSGASAPPDAELFRRGKQVLGNNAGGMIKRLLVHEGGNIAMTRSHIEKASTKQDPREFIGAILRGPGKRETRNGFAALAAEFNTMEENDDGRTIDHEPTLSTNMPARILEVPARHLNRRPR